MVTDVTDGDTIALEGVGRVRLVGVDTQSAARSATRTDYLRGRVGGRTVRYRLPSPR